MTPIESVEKDLDRHQKWLSHLAEDVHNLQLWRERIMGIMLACSFTGSLLGSVLVLFLSWYFKR